MYYQFTLLKKTNIDADQLTLQKCVIVGNWIMVISLSVVSACLLMTFGFEQYFGIASQVAAHISTIVFAALLKIGYVLRCVGAHGLGHKAF